MVGYEKTETKIYRIKDVVFLSCLLASVGLFIINFPSTYEIESTMMFLMVFTILVSSYFYHRVYNNPLTFFTPLYMVLVPYSFYFIVFPFDMVLKEKVLISDQDVFFPIAMIYVFFGLLSFVSGFFFVLWRNRLLVQKSTDLYMPQKTGPQDVELDARRGVCATVVAFFVASLLWIFAVLEAGGIGHILANLNDVYLNFFSKNMYLVSVINALFFANLSLHYGITLKRGRGRILFTINALLVFFMMLMQGSRGAILAVFFFMFVAAHLYRKRFSFAYIFAFFLLILSLMTGWLFLRDVLDPSQISVAELVYDALLSVNDEMTLLLGFISTMPQELSFKLGTSFFQLLLVPVPRSIWPGKPEVFQVETTRIFMPMFSELDINWPPSIIGELYANFHVYGILLGMLLFGALCGYLQCYVFSKRSYFRVLIYSITLFAVFREVRGDFATVTSIFLMQVLVFLLFAKLAFSSSASDSNNRNRKTHTSLKAETVSFIDKSIRKGGSSANQH